MSGYLHGLVARASGAPLPDASSARARRPLRFPIVAADGEPTVTDAGSHLAGLGRALESPATPQHRERDDDRGLTVRERPVAPSPADRAAPAADALAAPPIAAAPALTAATTAPPARAPARTDGFVSPRVPARPHDGPSDAGYPEPAPQPPTTVRLRPAPAPAPPTPTTPPRIEIHIGRVEVRRPAPPAPAPPAWSRGDADPSPAPRGFGELAAARRYVDRLER